MPLKLTTYAIWVGVIADNCQITSSVDNMRCYKIMLIGCIILISLSICVALACWLVGWLVVLVFYGASTFFRSFQARSVNLSTLFLGKPLRQFTST